MNETYESWASHGVWDSLALLSPLPPVEKLHFYNRLWDRAIDLRARIAALPVAYTTREACAGSWQALNDELVNLEELLLCLDEGD